MDKALGERLADRPVRLFTFPLPDPVGTFKSIRANTRARYMTPMEQVNKIVEASFPKPKRRNPDKNKPRVFNVTADGLKEV